MSRFRVIAECERCGGYWTLDSASAPDVLEGACQDCQRDSDSEKPLTFRAARPGDHIWPPLPADWPVSGA
jgi:hypothetical protein